MYPQGPRSTTDPQADILDAIVEALRTIPGVGDVRWMSEDTASGFDPDAYPTILVLRRSSRPFGDTNTSELIAVRGMIRAYVRGDDPRAIDLELLRLEGATRDVLVNQSFGNRACAAMTDIGEARPMKVEGGEEDVRVYNYDFAFVFMRSYGP